jgi:hypothetical protein
LLNRILTLLYTGFSAGGLTRNDPPIGGFNLLNNKKTKT